MKSTGIIRKVDDLGRIVLPIELRRTLDIAERDELEIYMENDRIILQKFEPACVFCGSSRVLVSYRGKNVCQECIQNMAES
jgi:transcriptional pleiotropic regulator of transition state genes